MFNSLGPLTEICESYASGLTKSKRSCLVLATIRIEAIFSQEVCAAFDRSTSLCGEVERIVPPIWCWTTIL